MQATRIPTKYALEVRFGIFSEEEVKRLGVVEITNE